MLTLAILLVLALATRFSLAEPGSGRSGGVFSCHLRQEIDWVAVFFSLSSLVAFPASPEDVLVLLGGHLGNSVSIIAPDGSFCANANLPDVPAPDPGLLRSNSIAGFSESAESVVLCSGMTGPPPKAIKDCYALNVATRYNENK